MNTLAPTHVSLRKLRRKVEQDGLRSACFNSAETVYRRHVLPPVFRLCLDRGLVRILEDRELTEAADIVVEIDYDGASTSRKVFEISEGTIVPETGLCLVGNDSLISASVGSPDLAEDYTIETLARTDFDVTPLTPKLITGSRVLGGAKRIHGPVCLLTPRYRNYYHWIVGTVPKLRYVERYEESTGEEVTYMLPPNMPPWAAETLSLLGYSEDKFVIADEEAYRIHRLIVPSHPFPGRKADYEWLRDRMFGAIRSTPSSSITNIYISRENAIGRRVVNQDSVMQLLSKYGFEKFVLEDRSLEDNISLFSQADLVVSPHGAGLTDILFCGNSTVIELFGSRKNTAYEQISDILDLDYVGLNCDAVSTDIRVDLDDLEEVVVDRT